MATLHRSCATGDHCFARARPGSARLVLPQRRPSSRSRARSRHPDASPFVCSATPKRVDVAVCGGGLGGLALASALQSRGYDAHVFEAEPSLHKPESLAFALSKNAFAALEGCAPEAAQLLKQDSVERSALLLIRSEGAGKEPVKIDYAVPPHLRPSCVSWSQVQRVLSGFVSPELVHCNHRVAGYTEQPEEGLVRLHFKGQPDVEARLVVAADGVRSALRATMIPNDPGPRYLGQMCYDALLADPGASITGITPGVAHLGTCTVPGADHWRLQAAIMEAGGGQVWWRVLVEREEPAYLAGGEDGVQSPDGPLLGVRRGPVGVRANVQQLLRDGGLDYITPLVQATPESSISERAIVDRIPLDDLGASMFSPGGRVVLLGDAAHAMHPSDNQDLAMSLEDVYVLATLLDQHRDQLVGWRRDQGAGGAKAAVGADQAGLAAVLSEYQDARLSRVCHVQRVPAGNCGVASIRQAARPAGLAPDQAVRRVVEFFTWVSQFPVNARGDPSSEFWRPEPSTVAVKEHVRP